MWRWTCRCGAATSSTSRSSAEARERGTDLLIIRRRGRRGLLANLLIGEMVSRVVAHAPCSVLVCPRGARMWNRGVLLGVDPRRPEPALVALAAALALECDLPLSLCCVVAGESAREAGGQALAVALASALGRGARADGTVRVGRPHQELMAAAAEAGADLIVIGRNGPGTHGRALMGGTAQKVIGGAECPVLVHVASAPLQAGTP